MVCKKGGAGNFVRAVVHEGGRRASPCIVHVHLALFRIYLLCLRAVLRVISQRSREENGSKAAQAGQNWRQKEGGQQASRGYQNHETLRQNDHKS